MIDFCFNFGGFRGEPVFEWSDSLSVYYFPSFIPSRCCMVFFFFFFFENARSF